MIDRPEQSSRTWRFFRAFVTRRAVSASAVVAVCGVLGYFASTVRTDFSIEMSFPTFDDSRQIYDAYRAEFPGDDSRALVIVESPELYTPIGIHRIAKLEDELGTIPGVLEVEGLTTTNDITGEDGLIELAPLFPAGDELDQELVDERKAIATSDPLFVWNLAHPDGHAATIRVDLDPVVASDEAHRTEVYRALKELVERHEISWAVNDVDGRITLGGIPITRSQYTELVTTDLNRMFPVALALILLLLFITFRRARDVFVSLATIVASVVWTMGAMALIGIPLQMLTQLTPIVVMIISISDTVHIVAHYKQGLGSGLSERDAIADSLALNNWPCFLTELTIACGFVALVANDMVMIQQFGIVTAVGMILTWAANVTVLPLLLSLFRAKDRDRSAPGDSGATRLFSRFVSAVETIVATRGRRVFAVAAVFVVVAAVMSARVDAEYFINADLRPESQLYQDVEYVDDVVGGNAPLVIWISDPDREPNAMLEPEALALIDRVTRHLQDHYPEAKSAISLSKFLRKSHRLFAGDDIADDMPLPDTRALASKELLMVDDPAVIPHMLSFDRTAAAVTVMMPDKGSTRGAEILASVRRYLEAESAATGYRLEATGIYRMANAIYEGLVGGLARSLAIAVVFTFFVFCLVLRSWRLGLIALVPNLLPLLCTLGLMAALGIALKPSTVILFSITLVIADDDTIQFMTRWRRRYVKLHREGCVDPHALAGAQTLRETGIPMLITTLAISTGFLVLLGSEFLGLSHLGLLTGISLLTAVIADLFLSPLLLRTLRPKIVGARGRVPTATAHEASDG